MGARLRSQVRERVLAFLSWTVRPLAPVSALAVASLPVHCVAVNAVRGLATTRIMIIIMFLWIMCAFMPICCVDGMRVMCRRCASHV